MSNLNINYKNRNPIEYLIKKYNKRIVLLKIKINILIENRKNYMLGSQKEYEIDEKIEELECLIGVYYNILEDLNDIYEKYNISLKKKDRGILQLIRGIFEIKKFQ